MDTNQPPPGSGERRGSRGLRGAPGGSDRRPALLGVFVAAGALGAWLLRRERSRPPEGTWRDLLTSREPPTGTGNR